MGFKNNKMNTQQWFTDRIGKRVFRILGLCQCQTCINAAKNGILIIDQQHADYLYLVSQELGIAYYDEFNDNQITELSVKNRKCCQSKVLYHKSP